jgi:hypothetical protein
VRAPHIAWLPQATLVLAALALGLARLATGPWYHVYDPRGVVLLDGLPAEWETRYYLEHFPTFLGNAPPGAGIAPVHYRVFASLFLTTTLYGWIQSAYWSLATIDLAAWCAAAIATYHLSQRLGAPRRAAWLGALLATASPLLISNMWSHVLHLAEFASLPLGLWAAVVLVEEPSGQPRRPGWPEQGIPPNTHWEGSLPGHVSIGWRLGLLLFLLSVTYQYHWVVLPLLPVLLLATPGWTPRRAAVAVGLAIVVFVVATGAMKAALAIAGLAAAGAEVQAVAQPGSLAAARLAGVQSIAQLRSVLPSWGHVAATAALYHPWVFAAGLAGLVLLPWRTRLLAAGTIAISLVAYAAYAAPWTAMTAYPFIYLGAGAACHAAGAGAARCLALLRRWQPGAAAATARWSRRAGLALSLALAVALASLTNHDLVGDATFLLSWWNSYSPRPLF